MNEVLSDLPVQKDKKNLILFLIKNNISNKVEYFFFFFKLHTNIYLGQDVLLGI